MSDRFDGGSTAIPPNALLCNMRDRYKYVVNHQHREIKVIIDGSNTEYFFLEYLIFRGDYVAYIFDPVRMNIDGEVSMLQYMDHGFDYRSILLVLGSDPEL